VRRTLAVIGADSILDVAHEPVDARGPAA
jgi:hypothetical protein